MMHVKYWLVSATHAIRVVSSSLPGTGVPVSLEILGAGASWT